MRETIGSALLCLAALANWLCTDSGWILFFAFLGAYGILDSIQQSSSAKVAGVIVSSASSAAWLFHLEHPNSGWVFLLSGLSIMCTLNALSDTVGIEK